MPKVLDNIEQLLLPYLREAIGAAQRADFCVGYFNLRGWRAIDDLVEALPPGDSSPCRLLIGMHQSPKDELRAALSINRDDAIDQAAVVRLKRKVAEEFREQLTIGAPNNDDEAGLRRLSRQLRAGQVCVKLHLRFPLHAKLYLARRSDPFSPLIGIVGSSNLTFSGLEHQGELNVDVVEQDAAQKLANWFEERWNDRWCVDISSDLADVIDESWAREVPIPPYHIYLKIAWHLSQEARAGISEFRIPAVFENTLFAFQATAVRIAAGHLHRRGGVMIGDVVGLGKTLMATALARIFEEDFDQSTLIICPKNLIKMWQAHVDEYGLRAKVISLASVERELENPSYRFRMVLIDESHNLRNREGRRFRVIQDFIQRSGSRCILLTATPFNKDFRDLSNQLRLFVAENEDLGIRPENYIREIGETEFIRRHQAPPRSLAAFEQSEYADDWRELMRLFLVRRTRSFIQQNYAQTDAVSGRTYLPLADGTPSYFPTRVPKTLKFAVDEHDPNDIYARLFAPAVVNTINGLHLPRYGLGNYVRVTSGVVPTAAERELLQGLSRAGQRLKGFSRTNMFKRLESSGAAFVETVDRHVLRNFVFLHALENGLPLPIGTQDAAMLDPSEVDEDADATTPLALDLDDLNDDGESAHAPVADGVPSAVLSEAEYRQRAAATYAEFASHYKRRFKWLRTALFDDNLGKQLLKDARALRTVLEQAGPWRAEADAKLAELTRLLAERHPHEKVIVFTQYADTVRYLTAQLQARGITGVEGVTGDSSDPTGSAWRFSPVSNGRRDRIAPAEELRVLIATDVLSEGQNLQDGAIVVNYDLPWAIIRLIQRVGRVDRIGQHAVQILAYTFMPAEGVEQVIQLRQRVVQRLKQNAEVVGTDEEFFEGRDGQQLLVDLYHEKAGILDGDSEGETDLASQALEIWNNAIAADPALKTRIEQMPDVVYSSRAHTATSASPNGVLLYLKTAQGNDALGWFDAAGNNVTQSQKRILDAAACHPATPALPRDSRHHDLVLAGVTELSQYSSTAGGQLGRPSGARFRSYTRLKAYTEQLPIFVTDELKRAIDDIYHYPLTQGATDTLNRQLRSGISDSALADLVLTLRAADRLCIIHEEGEADEPRIICSLGLW